jgi:diguanylate cyclase (GGDEF)-like protein/PAS domain S-box-containing protein
MSSPITLETLPVPAVEVDRRGVVVAATRECEAMFAGELRGVPVDALFPAEPRAWSRLRAVAGARTTVRLHAWRFTAVPFSLDARVSVARAGGETLVIMREVRGRDLLDESRRYLDVAFESAPIAMGLFNTDGQYERVNGALCALLGRTADALLGRRDQEFTHPNDRATDLEAADRILRGEMHTFQTEKRFVRPDGSVVWTIANLTFLRDPDGRPLCWVGQFQDITPRKADERRLRHLADHDPLTGLVNRRRLLDELERRVGPGAHGGERGALLVLDLDGFKAVNDRDGHSAGDAVLVSVARAFRGRLRATDVVARLGGDEFAVILPDADEAAAEAVATDLAAAIAACTAEPVTASCGIALYGPGRRSEPVALVASADRAMYAAKRGGRNCAHVAAAA